MFNSSTTTTPTAATTKSMFNSSTAPSTTTSITATESMLNTFRNFQRNRDAVILKHFRMPEF